MQALSEGIRNAMRTRTTIIGMLLLVGLLWPAIAEAQTHVLQPESRMWIEGTSTVGGFTCKAAEVDGQGTLETAAPGATPVPGRAQVLMPVRRFDCGKRAMNADFYEALRSREHPVIRFELADAQVLEAPEDFGGWHTLQATGQLTLAGTERRIEVRLEGRRLPGDRLQGRGEKTLLMSDFGVEPPTALLGLVKARDRITVRFDLIAGPDPATASN